MPAERLRELETELLAVPDHFTVHPKLARQLERRITALDEGGIDWGQAESLAFASLLLEGIPVRLTGQDSERGTFSHRHLVLHDANTGERYAPIQHLDAATASFEVHNSPLSEYACVGFEYGYSVAAPEALVLWEAQFGDFVNGAQIILDQFVTAGLSKWGETLRLTFLLPHGYEGNGPEHSSARLERFLQSTAQDNIRVVNPSTAAQYFHLLRRQALEPVARPLIVMTPKGLLRLREAASTLADLAEGSFRPVLDDAGADKEKVRRLVLCSGKVYYDIAGHELRAGADTVAVARIEQLYPFPKEAAGALVGSYPNLRGGRLGAGGAAEHGCLPVDPASSRGSAARRASRSSTSAAPGARARARATRPRTCASRTGSRARRSSLAARLAARRGGAGRPHRLRGDQRAVAPDAVHDQAAMPRREAAIEVERRQGETDRSRRFWHFRHTCSVAEGPVRPPPLPTLNHAGSSQIRYNRRRTRVPSRGGSHAG